MKKIILLLLIAATTKAQTGVITNGNNVLLYNTATISVSSFCINSNCLNDLKNGSTQLARILYDGTIIWDANLQSSSVSDTLGASGVEALSRITVPTTTGTSKIIQLDNIAIIAANATYTVNYNPSVIYPITITRISDGFTMCTIYPGKTVVWNTTIQNSWIGRIGTTRIKRITLP